MKPRIILIGGVAGAGKSTIALKVAHKLGIKQIVDVDSIRAVLRKERNQIQDPYLYYESYTAWKFNGKSDEKSITKSFLKYCHSLSKPIKCLIERAHELGKDAIIEGIHLVPSTFKEYLEKDNITLVILTCNSKSHKNRFHIRKKEFHNMDITEYLKQFKKIRWINGFLVRDAKKNGCDVIMNEGINSTVQKIVAISNHKIVEECVRRVE